MKILSADHEQFCQNVALEGLSFSQAALACGYSAVSCASIGSQLAAKPEIEARIRELRDRAAGIRMTVDSALRTQAQLKAQGFETEIYIAAGSFPRSQRSEQSA